MPRWGTAPPPGAFINKGMAMPNKEKDDPEIKARGRETLAKLPEPEGAASVMPRVVHIGSSASEPSMNV